MISASWGVTPSTPTSTWSREAVVRRSIRMIEVYSGARLTVPLFVTTIPLSVVLVTVCLHQPAPA